MRIFKQDALIELSAAETADFLRGEDFARRVLQRANDLSDGTDRTVCIWSPDAELGTYNAVIGKFEPASA